MIISNTLKRSVSSRLLVLGFILPLSIPLGASGAEDEKAKTKASPKDLYKQIEAAVIAGKITKEEAQAKLNALKKQGSPKSEAIKKRDDKKAIAHLDNIWAELQSLVAIGKMSPDEAASVISTIKQNVFAKDVNGKKANIKAPPKGLYKRIEAAVAAGRITKEEAQAKLNALKKQGSPKTAKQGKKAATEADLKKVWARLQAAVAAGKLTKEEAAAKMSAIKKAKLGGE